MNNYAELVTGVSNSQYVPQAGKESLMDKNHNGAYVFKLDKWKRLNRFLIIGVDNSTYYQSKKNLVKENYSCLTECLKEDFKRTVDTIVDVSVNARSPKNDTAIFALAVASLITRNLVEQEKADRSYAYSKVKEVCRIGTHLFMYLTYMKELKGNSTGAMGMGLQKAVKGYYNKKSLDALAMDTLKYRNREGWTHKDVFRLSRFKGTTEQNQVVDYIMKGECNMTQLPKIIEADIAIKACNDDVNLLIALISEFGVPWEMIPTEYLTNKEVLRALIPSMGATALIRNLSKLTSYEAIEDRPDCPHLKLVSEKLENEEYIKRGKVHPLQIATATLSYLSGTSKGGVTWRPYKKIVKALDVAFLHSFKNAEKLNINIDFALDVSGSMSWPQSEVNGIKASQLGCIMLSWLTKQEDFTRVFTFSNTYQELTADFSNYRDMWADIQKLSNFMSATNCALPVINALNEKRKVDLFIVWTDNETNSHHSGHASEYLKKYRKEVNPNAKMVVVGCTATDCSIADPTDPGMMDVAGFDSSIAQIISSFVKGW